MALLLFEGGLRKEMRKIMRSLAIITRMMYLSAI
jgi:hypothetical protein